MGFTRLRPRPWPNKQDEEARSAFQEKLFFLQRREVEIWYQDECGVLGDSRPRLIWAKKGSRPLLPFTGAHFKDNVIGAVRPRDGKFFSLIMPKSNTQTFQIFLDRIQKHVISRRAIMILDNATWHKPKKLNWGKIEPLFLPPYSPDFNPIERLWLNMKQTFFNMFTAITHDDLTNRLIDALCFYIDRPSLCKSICRMGNFI